MFPGPPLPITGDYSDYRRDASYCDIPLRLQSVFYIVKYVRGAIRSVARSKD